ncbi:Sexual development transcription factor NsdD [Balamuthia mandrillaris]
MLHLLSQCATSEVVDRPLPWLPKTSSTTTTTTAATHLPSLQENFPVAVVAQSLLSSQQPTADLAAEAWHQVCHSSISLSRVIGEVGEPAQLESFHLFSLHDSAMKLISALQVLQREQEVRHRLPLRQPERSGSGSSSSSGEGEMQLRGFEPQEEPKRPSRKKSSPQVAYIPPAIPDPPLQRPLAILRRKRRKKGSSEPDTPSSDSPESSSRSPNGSPPVEASDEEHCPKEIPGPVRKIKKRKSRKKTEAPPPTEQYCHACGITQTPEWRRGPDKQLSLCNACGLHFAKILKREKMLDVKPPTKCSVNMLLN